MSASGRPFNEKRDFIRMKINSTVKITHASNEYQGVCKDLSGAGMSILTGTAFNTGDQVDILIEQQKENHLPFHATATVSRVQQEDSGDYTIGLSIEQIHD